MDQNTAAALTIVSARKGFSTYVAMTRTYLNTTRCSDGEF
jgi:hypothetical protein